MLEVTIELKGRQWRDIDEALEEARKKLKERYLSGFDEADGDTGSYKFDVSGQEVVFCDQCEKEIQGIPYRDGALNFCDAKCHDDYAEEESQREGVSADE